MVTLTHLFKGEIINNSLLLVIIMSRPSRGTGTSDGALSAMDKEDPLYDDIDEARVDYASSGAEQVYLKWWGSGIVRSSRA